MMINEVTAKAGPHERRKRVGRGESSGMGRTSGRGNKGAQSRAGYGGRILSEGGREWQTGADAVQGAIEARGAGAGGVASGKYRGGVGRAICAGHSYGESGSGQTFSRVRCSQRFAAALGIAPQSS